jgi:hypothetical protein
MLNLKNLLGLQKSHCKVHTSSHPMLAKLGDIESRFGLLPGIFQKFNVSPSG